MALKSIAEYGLTLNDKLIVLQMEAIRQWVHLLDGNVLKVARPKGTIHNAL